MAKPKKKRLSNTTRNILIILFVGVVFYFVFAGSISFLLGEPNTCENTPKDYRCFCGTNQEKTTDGYNSWVCDTAPALPPVMFPIETWGEARAYASEQGLSTCPNDAYILGLPLNYSMEGATSSVECRRSDSLSNGELIWSTQFRNSDGLVISRFCNPSIIPTCPESKNVGALEEVEQPDEAGYICTSQELDGYIKSLDGMDKDIITDKLEFLCKNTIGDVISYNPPLDGNDLKFYTTTYGKTCTSQTGRTYSCGSSEYRRRVACSIGLEGIGGGLGLWGAEILSEDGSISTSGVQCSDPTKCDPNDPRYTDFRMVEIGLCFRIPSE